jgi:hypothetical protein
MRYSNRCTLIKVEVTEGPLGLTETETRTTKPCAVQNVSLNEQTTIYGQATTNALKLHFRGHQKGYERVEYEGETYNIVSERHFRCESVLYLEGNSHG